MVLDDNECACRSETVRNAPFDRKWTWDCQLLHSVITNNQTRLNNRRSLNTILSPLIYPLSNKSEFPLLLFGVNQVLQELF